ncbi:hypothetical protein EKK58_06055 [Candidatus Dependentiae bacterium]|nr:MAG: hypothetical protein EKK58_06055 [Candidatus Dependentiae bacterium]
MKRRCSNKNIKSSKNYVYKGITVCEEWQKFENFYRDMSDTYQENLTLDRINNALGYNKKNCQWVTKQKNSQKTSRVTFYKGLSARETSLLLGGNEDLVSSRLRAGWDIERAFTQKKNERKLL